jgi:ParB family transcriptional regulator, chromosome partitioning protein
MIENVALARIDPNPEQPRKEFPDEHIAALAASIVERGLIQPITLRPNGDRFMIVAGECRFRAHQRLGRETIRAEIVEITDAEMQLRAIVENLQRRDMHPLEEARAFQFLLDRGWTLPRIAQDLGVSRSLIDNRLDLLKCTSEIQRLVDGGSLSAAMAQAISWVEPFHQNRLVREINRGQLKTVQQVRHAAIALRDAAAQVDAFAEKPKASEKDLAALSRLERKVDDIARMVSLGFEEGECTIARRVVPDRVRLMADKLMIIRKHILAMEHALRMAATQGSMFENAT